MNEACPTIEATLAYSNNDLYLEVLLITEYYFKAWQIFLPITNMANNIRATGC